MTDYEAIIELINNGEEDAALAWLRPVLRTVDDYSQVLAWAITVYHERGRNDLALELYGEYPSLSPDVHVALLRVHASQGATEKALECARIAVLGSDEDEFVDYYVAFAFARAGQADEALRRYEESLRKWPLDRYLQNGFVLALLSAHRTNEALEHTIRYLEEDPHNDLLLRSKSRILMDFGRFDEARKVLESLSLDDTDFMSRMQLARVDRALGNFQTALIGYSHVLEERPNDIDALEGRAACHIELGHIEEGIRDYKTLIANSPENRRHIGTLINILRSNLRLREAWTYSLLFAGIIKGPSLGNAEES